MKKIDGIKVIGVLFIIAALIAAYNGVAGAFVFGIVIFPIFIAIFAFAIIFDKLKNKITGKKPLLSDSEKHKVSLINKIGMICLGLMFIMMIISVLFNYFASRGFII